MIPLQQIEKELREKIIESVPEIVITCTCYNSNKNRLHRHLRPITLADVLMVVPISFHNLVMSISDGYILFFDSSKPKWDLTRDLSNQKEEVKRFIYDVICK